MQHSFQLAAHENSIAPSSTAPTGAQVIDAMNHGMRLMRERRHHEAIRVLWAGFDTRNLVPHNGNAFALFFNGINSGADIATVEATRNLLVTLGDGYENTGDYQKAACCYHMAVERSDPYAWLREQEMEEQYGAFFDAAIWNDMCQNGGLTPAVQPVITERTPALL